MGQMERIQGAIRKAMELYGWAILPVLFGVSLLVFPGKSSIPKVILMALTSAVPLFVLYSCRDFIHALFVPAAKPVVRPMFSCRRLAGGLVISVVSWLSLSLTICYVYVGLSDILHFRDLVPGLHALFFSFHMISWALLSLALLSANYTRLEIVVAAAAAFAAIVLAIYLIFLWKGGEDLKLAGGNVLIPAWKKDTGAAAPLPCSFPDPNLPSLRSLRSLRLARTAQTLPASWGLASWHHLK
jgi:hypothetical protein